MSQVRSQALPGNALPRGSASRHRADIGRQSLQDSAFPGGAWERVAMQNHYREFTMLMRMKFPRPGFTLVELLVALALIVFIMVVISASLVSNAYDLAEALRDADERLVDE